jgi:apolipoprotein N-acyltransferase
MTRSPNRTLHPAVRRWLKPWTQPAPWLALILLLITASSQPPRLWFWLALLLIVLLVGWAQALKHPSANGD